MYYSFQGIITASGDDYVVIEVNDVGYQIYVPRVDRFPLGQKAKIYVHDVIREDDRYLVGFPSLEEKKVFLLLLGVKGIGPRTALNALSATTAGELSQAIEAHNVAFLKSLPGIGVKAAQQIILDLRGRLSFKSKVDPGRYHDVREALKKLGFRVAEIDPVLASLHLPDAANDELLRQALKKLGKH